MSTFQGLPSDPNDPNYNPNLPFGSHSSNVQITGQEYAQIVGQTSRGLPGGGTAGNRDMRHMMRQMGITKPGGGGNAVYGGTATQFFMAQKLREKADQEAARQALLNAYAIDPNTGAIQGPSALPPPEIAAEIQARQDRQMLLLQQRKLADATDMERGALGLMQSFRPGGGAALEANMFGRVAGSMRAETAAFQPLDLLYELRSEETEKARRAAAKASKQSGFAQIIGAAATVVGTIYGGPAGGAAAGAAVGAITKEGQLDPTTAGIDPSATGGGVTSPAAKPVTADTGGVAPTAPSETIAPGESVGPKAAGPQPKAGGKEGAPDAAAPVLGAGLDAPGANGDFSGAAFASAAARTYDNPLQRALMHIAMNEAIADMYDEDPFYGSFDAAVEQLIAPATAGVE